MSFKEKVVVVTGSSSGIGASIAIQFAAEGAKVVIVGRNEVKLKTVFEQCEKHGNQTLSVTADMNKDEDIKRIVDETIKRFGKIDVLVNNAGIGASASILAENALEIFDKVISTNLRSAVCITNLAAPHLVKTKGNIINISSIASLGVLSPNNFIYGASKAGLDHFTRCIALELAGKGVRVNSVNPGPVKTDIISNMGVSESYQEKIWNIMKKGTALDRIAEPEEIADIVLFLASDKARSITGSIYVSDNGALLKGLMPAE
ncbi:3-oxoacyl-[acyl-carrier-protein] reductase FabG [Bombyx mori]|uniref:Uncharacterized protein n=1 Tax=Bombyx mori TaxID=7091 RepID=A0A8R2AKP9_BOMMO|nr:3-oxoacyl-[acyl-carrier-protein] reductase FabG [Bombyx mori]